MVEVNESECCRENFLFSNVHPWELYAPQCHGSKVCVVLYLLWRALTAAYFASSLTYFSLSLSIDEDGIREKWLIYLTVWSFLVFCLHQLWSAATSFYVYASHGFIRPDTTARLRWYLKINWFLYSGSQSLAIVVAVLFWALLYRQGQEVTYETVLTHGGSAAQVLLVDIWVSAVPVRALHFYVPVAFAVIYGVFSVGYDYAGGMDAGGNPYIYQILDWSADPAWAAVYAALVLGAVLVAYFLLFALYRIKSAVYNECLRTRREARATQEMVIREIYCDSRREDAFLGDD